MSGRAIVFLRQIRRIWSPLLPKYIGNLPVRGRGRTPAAQPGAGKLSRPRAKVFPVLFATAEVGLSQNAWVFFAVFQR